MTWPQSGNTFSCSPPLVTIEYSDMMGITAINDKSYHAVDWYWVTTQTWLEAIEITLDRWKAPPGTLGDLPRFWHSRRCHPVTCISAEKNKKGPRKEQAPRLKARNMNMWNVRHLGRYWSRNEEPSYLSWYSVLATLQNPRYPNH